LTEADLDEELTHRFIQTRRLHRENSRMVHLRSLSNFMHILTSEQEVSSKEKNNSNRVELGRLGKKELLLEYLQRLVEEKEVNIELSDKYFHEYIKPLGNYMSSYYKFSFIGGGAFSIKFAFFLTAGIILDYLILLMSGRVIYFTILVLILFFF
jgi:hypothetical protein